MSHRCPICLSKILRREVKTCGGIDCLAEFRQLTASQKIAFTERANTDIPNEVAPLQSDFLSNILGKKVDNEQG